MPDVYTIHENNVEMKQMNIEPPPSYESLFLVRPDDTRQQDSRQTIEF